MAAGETTPVGARTPAGVRLPAGGPTVSAGARW